nr:immunoglobulin heavy chain junction region [Macaca mulatta]
CARGGEDFDFW